MLNAILLAAAVIVVISVAIGVLLGFMSEKFKVEVDPRESQIRDCLAGSNCGGCGYAGCDAYAHAIVYEGAAMNLCPSSDKKTIGNVMGVCVIDGPKMTAFVKCNGNCRNTRCNYNYGDERDCRIAYSAPGHGAKKCVYGCCGLGTCASVCPYDAIRIVDGLAKIDRTKCQACGKCVSVCPNHLIEIIPDTAPYAVACSSRSKGKDVKAACDTGCIGCSMCARVCESGAITVENNLAKIDYKKCTGCGKCAEKCPCKIITMRNI